jgi:hypothetical protein
MSINNISSSSALYESLLKQLKASSKTSETDAYAKAQAKVDPSTETTQSTQPTAQDIKTLLGRLLGSQPTLMDFMNTDSSNQNDLLSSSLGLDSMDSSATASDPTSFDPISAMLQTFSAADSGSNSNSNGSDSSLSLWSSLGNSLNPTQLGDLLDKAYSQSSQEAQSVTASGQLVDKKN